MMVQGLKMVVCLTHTFIRNAIRRNKEACLTPKAGAFKAVHFPTTLLALFICGGEREVTGSQLLPSRQVMQCSEADARVSWLARSDSSIKAVEASRVGQAVVV